MKAGKTECALLLTLVMVDAVFLAGCACAGSLRPVASPETLTTAPQLEGRWVATGSDNKEIVTVTRPTEKSYQARWTEDNKGVDLVFDLSLVQIEGNLFFDAAFNHAETKEGDETIYDLGVVPIHFLGRIWIEEKSIRLSLLKYEWVEQKVKDGQVKLAYVEHHATDEDLILFTAKAEEVQAFLRQCAEDPEAFTKSTDFERVTAEGDSTAVKP